MADPHWNWFDWRSWLWLLCSAVGLTLGAVFYAVAWTVDRLLTLIGLGDDA